VAGPTKLTPNLDWSKREFADLLTKLFENEQNSSNNDENVHWKLSVILYNTPLPNGKLIAVKLIDS